MDYEKPTSVYRLYDEIDALLYIGMTSTPATRWQEHRKEMLWWPEVSEKRFTWYDNRIDAWDAERQAIHQEAPRYNKSTSPDRVPYLPPGIPPQPFGARTAYQYRETRGGYRIQWYLWRLRLQDALETSREQNDDTGPE
ncbi:GIY-YIG nuclease family protein [Streptomyces sp. NPDC101490]|uniref:GIY-YIG nuclease family protein n=1 Tax=Streptomyces sp. NPDC101490 TaxID=3366143 RepID=UPI0038277CBB